MQPKVLVGCPTSRHKLYCIDEYIEGLKQLDYSNFDIILVDNSEDDSYFNLLKEKFKDFPKKVIIEKIDFTPKARDRIVKARNKIKEKAISGNYDYFFSLEQDVIPVPDTIQRLLKHDKKVISGVYYILKPAHGYMKNTLHPVLFEMHPETGDIRLMHADEVEEERVIEVGACGLGCVLIHRDLLDRFEFRFNPENKAFDDIWFSLDMKELKQKIFCDTSIKCRHMLKGRSAENSWHNIEQ
ncbi:glycosyltransferase family 2 protein [Candidatus Woesearchaeota archaeon]|nr:glycosyltransferase family 2 protein [Candidatus Woesearchaeota archaeon]